jgi:hypothetical protein
MKTKCVLFFADSCRDSPSEVLWKCQNDKEIHQRISHTLKMIEQDEIKDLMRKSPSFEEIDGNPHAAEAINSGRSSNSNYDLSHFASMSNAASRPCSSQSYRNSCVCQASQCGGSPRYDNDSSRALQHSHVENDLDFTWDRNSCCEGMPRRNVEVHQDRSKPEVTTVHPQTVGVNMIKQISSDAPDSQYWTTSNEKTKLGN